MKTNAAEKALITAVLLICFCGALMIDTKHCPDEVGRMLINDYIYNTRRFPVGDEPETIMKDWGFSYALRPYLSSVIGACSMRLAAIFTQSKRILMAMSRMCSVLSMTGCAYFLLKAGNLLFKDRLSSMLLAVSVCLLPQAVFIGMYLNNDALSLMAVSMEIYYLVKGSKDNWNIKTCIGLALSMAIGMLSYYSIYPWLLLGGVFCIISCARSGEIENKTSFIASRMLLVVAIVLILSGPFFIRNAMAHNGDFLGIAYEKISREAMRAKGAQLYDYHPGCTRFGSFREFIREWVSFSLKSLIGGFGHMLIYLSRLQYAIYIVPVALLELWVMIKAHLDKDKSILEIRLQRLLFIGGMVVILMSIYASWFRDYQPQGRYIITAALPLSFAIAYGMDRYAGRTAKAGFITAWTGMFLWAFFGTMTSMFV